MLRVLLDTDLAMGTPGSDIDDGFALALAVADPEISLELVTTVNGNTDVDTATRLTLELLDRLGADTVPVARGATAPLLRTTPRSPDGAEVVLPPGADPSGRQVSHAARHLVERVMAEPGRLTVVAIGPLTNVALALALEPRLADAVAEIVVMGGVYLGHTNVAAMPGEFNFWVDPEAAAMVLASGAPLRLVGLDVTRQVRMSSQDAARLREGGGSFGAFAADCTDGWIDHLARTVPGDEREHGSCALHDPLAVAALSRPDLLTWRPAHVRVETAGERTRGVAVADLLTTDSPPEPNCRIAVAVDTAGFREHLLRALADLP
jgi:inosine-uridine nucleoside N-ribohydrolase